MKTNPFFKNNKNNKNRNMDPKEKENINEEELKSEATQEEAAENEEVREEETQEETGALVTTDYKRHRVTGGVTFSLSKAFRTDLRLNFEKYFYAKNSIAKESEQDKIVLELMVRF